jgi:hypothetical protein
LKKVIRGALCVLQRSRVYRDARLMRQESSEKAGRQMALKDLRLLTEADVMSSLGDFASARRTMYRNDESASRTATPREMCDCKTTAIFEA